MVSCLPGDRLYLMVTQSCPSIQIKRLIACKLTERVMPLYLIYYPNRTDILDHVRRSREFSNLILSPEEITQSLQHITDTIAEHKKEWATLMASDLSKAADARHRMVERILTACAWCCSSTNDEDDVLQNVSSLTILAIGDYNAAEAMEHEARTTHNIINNYRPNIDDSPPPIHQNRPHLIENTPDNDHTIMLLNPDEPTSSIDLVDTVIKLLERNGNIASPSEPTKIYQRPPNQVQR